MIYRSPSFREYMLKLVLLNVVRDIAQCVRRSQPWTLPMSRFDLHRPYGVPSAKIVRRRVNEHLARPLSWGEIVLLSLQPTRKRLLLLRAGEPRAASSAAERRALISGQARRVALALGVPTLSEDQYERASRAQVAGARTLCAAELKALAGGEWSAVLAAAGMPAARSTTPVGAERSSPLHAKRTAMSNSSNAFCRAPTRSSLTADSAGRQRSASPGSRQTTCEQTTAADPLRHHSRPGCPPPNSPPSTPR
ncbi:MAG: hypothetical protein ACLP01_28485 [Solirubrobacteraceae bacterium]